MSDVRPMVLYGNGKLAELILDAFAADERYRFCAVAADPQFISAESFRGLPLVPFDALAREYPPESTDLLVAIGYSRMRARREMLGRARAAGYRLANCIGRGARVYPDLQLGGNVIVFDLAYIGPRCRLGTNTVIRPQTYLGHDGVVGDHTFVAAGVTIGGGCRIGDLSFLGLAATVTDGRTIADECLIGAGSLVIHDTLPCGCYIGQPARRVHELADTGVVLA